jgi:phosphohistidine phosphatase SixA
MHSAGALPRKVQLTLASLGFLLCTPTLLLAAQLIGDRTPKLQGQELINALKQGGYVIYFRHGATNKFGEADVPETDLANCEIQRNLSPEGVAQTKDIGAAFRRHRLPIGDVYTSPYCRCVDTAMHIFGKAQKADFLHFAIHTTESRRQTITQTLRDKFAEAPQPGMNTGIVSHTANLMGAVQIFPSPEGVAHIFKPEGKGNFSYVGVMAPEAWLAEETIVAKADTEEQGWFDRLTQWVRNLF